MTSNLDLNSFFDAIKVVSGEEYSEVSSQEKDMMDSLTLAVQGSNIQIRFSKEETSLEKEQNRLRQIADTKLKFAQQRLDEQVEHLPEQSWLRRIE